VCSEWLLYAGDTALDSKTAEYRNNTVTLANAGNICPTWYRHCRRNKVRIPRSL